MAGLLAYAAAGALQGAGKGIVDEAMAQREAMLRQMGWDREDQRDARNRADRQRERAEDREYDAKTRAEDRAFQMNREDRSYARDRAAKKEDREFEAGLPGEDYVDADGNMVTRSKDGSKVTPLTDDKGRPIPGQKKDGNRISDNQMRLIRKDFDEMAGYGDEPSIAAAVEDTLATYPGLDAATLRTWAKNKLAEDPKMTPADIEKALANMGLGPMPADEKPKGNGLMPSAPKGDAAVGGDSGEPARPEGLPAGAKWSQKVGAWVILRDGKWMRLDPGKGDAAAQ